MDTGTGRSGQQETPVAQAVLPRWRGFNLLDMFTSRSTCAFQEDDFRWISDWGFDFVRLPMCYLLWTDPQDVYIIREEVLENVDRAIEWGRHYGIHVCLNFHRAPGYSVNREREEPFNLWKDEAALDAFCFHWRVFAERYRGIPSSLVSFNLVNEPKRPSDEMSRDDHERVMRRAVAEIRSVDPRRLIILDGLSWGQDPCPELADLRVAQSCRAYAPAGVSHYKASWAGGESWPEPSWPGTFHGQRWDRQRLEQHYAPWVALARRNVGVHCGEGGAFRFTPQRVLLAWLRDVLEILTAANIGYALWNFRGSFGILDVERPNAPVRDWHGHALDEQLLNLLREF